MLMICPRSSECKQDINYHKRFRKRLYQSLVYTCPDEVAAKRNKFRMGEANDTTSYLCRMKSAVYSSKYFIVVGIFVFLCFTAIWQFLSKKLSNRTEEISTEMAAKNYQVKSAAIRNEFNSIISGIDNVDAILTEIRSRQDFIAQRQFIAALLLSHPKTNKGDML